MSEWTRNDTLAVHIKLALGRSWDGIQISPFRVDDHRFKIKDGYHKPTFNWYAIITARRSDGVDFCVNVPLARKDGANHAARFRAIASGMEMLETFRACKCVAGSRCNLHAEVIDA